MRTNLQRQFWNFPGEINTVELNSDQTRHRFLYLDQFPCRRSNKNESQDFLLCKSGTEWTVHPGQYICTLPLKT